MATSGAIQFQVADWSRRGDGWARAGVVVIERNRDGGWGMTDVSGNWSEHACPDAAREAADAYLVSQGRLDKSRAFVRLGEWEPAPECGDGYMMRRQASGHSPLTLCACGKEARASSDASAVASGWLDPSRAFKVPTLAECVTVGTTGATGVVWPANEYMGVPMGPAARMPPQTHNSEPVYDWPREYLCKPLEPAKPAWGEWERRTIHGGKEPYKAFLRASSVADSDLLFAKATEWGHGSITHPATDIDDAREKADAFLVARGELEAGLAFKRVGDWVKEPGQWTRLVDGVRRFAEVTGSEWSVRGTDTAGVGESENRARADAELVRRGLLAEERAFKVAKPSAVYAQRIFLPESTESFTVESNGARPFYVQRSPDGQTRVTDWNGASCAVGPGDALTYTITDGVGRFAVKVRVSVDQWAVVGTVSPTRTIAPGPEETVTLANWEHHLPALLSAAPREFRDGFNRRQGPAWEAYLRGLAWLKEEMQFGRHARLNVSGAIDVAAMTAREWLGIEWCRANYKPVTVAT